MMSGQVRFVHLLHMLGADKVKYSSGLMLAVTTETLIFHPYSRKHFKSLISFPKYVPLSSSDLEGTTGQHIRSVFLPK